MIDTSQYKQLFLDDYAIESTEGVKRTLHSPEDSKPIISPDRSRGEEEATGRTPPQWNSEKSIWEWFYWTAFTVPPIGERKTTHQRIGTYATSADGVEWERPNLGLYEFQGSKDNNISWTPGGDRQTHVIRDETDPDPARRYKGIFGANGRQPAISAAGFEWTELDGPRIPGQDTDHIFWDPYKDRWTMTIKHRTEWGRSVWLTSSEDFDNWTEAELIFLSDDLDWANKDERIRMVVEDPDYLAPPLIDDGSRSAEVYWMAVLPYEGIYVGFPMLFNPAADIPPPYGNYTGLNLTEMSVSRNLYDWDRVAGRQLFLGPQPQDNAEFGWAQRSVCGHPVVRDGEIWVYQNNSRYRGPDYLYDFLPEEVLHARGALSLGKLRLDGFVSMDSDNGSGTLVTKPIAANGEALHVNVDASGGELMAEVVDAETADVVGSGTVKGDHVDETVVSGLGGGRPVRVRFTLNDASLYSFWVK